VGELLRFDLSPKGKYLKKGDVAVREWNITGEPSSST
jgi:hypothetical protein